MMPLFLRPAREWTLPGRARSQPLSATQLHRRYCQAVLRYASARLGQGAEAEDVVAETFGAAMARLDSCPRPPESEQVEDDPARAWLLGIARRKVADALRRRTRAQRETPLSETLTTSGSDHPETQALAGEAAQVLRQILTTLPDDQHEALLLKYVDGLSLIEIGKVLGRSPRAANQLLYRAREAVRTRGGHYFLDLGEEG